MTDANDLVVFDITTRRPPVGGRSISTNEFEGDPMTEVVVSTIDDRTGKTHQWTNRHPATWSIDEAVFAFPTGPNRFARVAVTHPDSGVVEVWEPAKKRRRPTRWGGSCTVYHRRVEG